MKIDPGNMHTGARYVRDGEELYKTGASLFEYEPGDWLVLHQGEMRVVSCTIEEDGSQTVVVRNKRTEEEREELLAELSKLRLGQLGSGQ